MFEHKIKSGPLLLCIVRSDDRKKAINEAVKLAVESQEMGFCPEIHDVDAESWELVDEVQNWEKERVH